MASDDEILVTLGAQNALYLLTTLLVSRETRVGMEEPGYPDVRNIFIQSGRSDPTSGVAPPEGTIMMQDGSLYAPAPPGNTSSDQPSTATNGD